MKSILIIGCGHMGAALLNSWQNLKQYKISVVDPLKYKVIRKQYRKNKIKTFETLNELNNFVKFDFIIFAVKPQVCNQVIKEFKLLNLNSSSVIVSIIAGKKINFFKKNLNSYKQFIRVMPNMPAQIQQGVSCIVANKNVTFSNKKNVDNLFSKVGTTIWLKSEDHLDMATAVSGSGPGFVFNLLYAMEKAAIELGFNKIVARKLVIQTFLGSLNLVKNSKNPIPELINSIALKGGTTEAGLKTMNSNKIYKIISKTVSSAYKRAKFLGKDK